MGPIMPYGLSHTLWNNHEQQPGALIILQGCTPTLETILVAYWVTRSTGGWFVFPAVVFPVCSMLGQLPTLSEAAWGCCSCVTCDSLEVTKYVACKGQTATVIAALADLITTKLAGISLPGCGCRLALTTLD
jgi:hypothetical protein